MKKKFILLPVVCALLYMILSSYSEGPAHYAGQDYSGATGAAGCGGGGCHGTSSSATTTVTVTLLSGSTPVTTYTPGNSYTLRISGTNSGASVALPYYGFQLCVVKSVSGVKSDAGSFSSTHPTGTDVKALTISGSTISIWEHYNSGAYAAIYTGTSGGAGTTYTQNISWTAPSAGTGCITAYGALNTVDHDFSATGFDQWNTTSVVFNEAAASISGTTSVCVGKTTTLSDATGCGTWSSSNTSVASVVATTGVVTGVANGTATISYIAGTGNFAITTVTVSTLTAPFTGSTTLCATASTTLGTIFPGGGTWTSSTSSVATIGLSSGSLSGVSAGTSTITFTAALNGCYTTSVVTVNALPGTISGSLGVCQGTTSALTDGGSGTWASSNTSVATVTGSGGVFGVSTGTATITFAFATGCMATAVVTVNPLPVSITGTTTVCPLLTTALSDVSGTGTWTSSNTGVATVSGSSGLVTGVSGGTSAISYTITSTGCSTGTVVTVSAPPSPVTGVANVCSGLTTPLTDATGGGTWSSSNTTVATVNTSGVVSGGSAGTTTITYTAPVSGCISIDAVTVNSLPSGIGGNTTVCQGLTTTVSDATGVGNWSSSNTDVSFSPASGNVVTLSGVAAGATTISYTLSGTGCYAVASFTVNALPTAVLGPTAVCSGSTVTLSDATPGGTWSTSGTAVSVVGSTGAVTAIGAIGFALVTYTLPTGCQVTRTETINLVPNSITGTASVCAGATTSLGATPSSGTWSSSNTGIATVGSTGIVTGVMITGGTDTIIYTLSDGCSSSRSVTVNASPSLPVASGNVCASGGKATISDAVGGGTWSSSNTTVATIGTGGAVTGNIAGTTTISYTLGSGCKSSFVLTVYALPATVSGSSLACIGAATALSDVTAGGTWLSSNTTISTVSSSGIVTGAGPGSDTISYIITASGCAASKPMTVNAAPAAITGTAIVCKGQATSLSDAVGAGNWSSSNTSIATVNSSGLVTGTGSGTATITFTVPSTGCAATKVVTVNPLSPITGTTSLCAGLTTTLSDATTVGTWKSTNTSVATINSVSGSMSSISSGTSVISYTVFATGCVATTTVNIVSSPSGIIGNTLVCLGQTSALTDAGGGTWTSGSTGVATVGASSGVVSGGALGTATITYSLGTSCTVTTLVTVNPVPSSIGGTTASMCIGASVTLSDAAAGGAWSSSNTSIATVGSSGTGGTGVVTGIAAGTATISYALPTGCAATRTITVNASPGTISGSTEICQGSTAALSDAGSGTWSSSNTAVATISGSGLLSGLSAGTSSITYTLSATGCQATIPATIDPLPSSISGPGSVCLGATVTLSDAGGGTWSSSNTNVSTAGTTGLVTGMALGTTIITYTLPTGCTAIKTMTINALPLPISGLSAVCIGALATLSDATGGGTWTSDNTSVATIGSTGLLAGVSAGTADITFTRTSTGCMATEVMTVNPLPATITGTLSVCESATTTLSDAITGGAWTSSSANVSVNITTGDVFGVHAGTATIVYMLPTSCFITATVLVNPFPGTISGPANVCIGSTVTLSDGGGGTWSSGSTAISVGGSTGTITGLSYGTGTVTYMLATGCTTTITMAVDSLPVAISGGAVVCSGDVLSLSDATTGGAWSSGSTGIATISTGGALTGIAGGTATITYMLPTGCVSASTILVNPSPAAISGTAHVCNGLTISLSDGTGGGTWSSGATTVATISSTGVVTGSTPGTATISYTLSTGCLAALAVTVNPLPSSISGTTHVCVSATTGLSDGGGGTWSSAATGTATVSTSGVVTGHIAGTTTITYTLATGCTATTTITVNPLADAGSITGAAFTCISSPGTLSDAVSGGVWSSSNTAVATVTAGAVTGVSAGTAIISYSVTNSCNTAVAAVTDTVFDIVSLGTLSGTDSVCAGDSVVLGDTVTGGVWTSSNGNATVSPTGIVTGVTAGTAIISYSKATICGTVHATATITINSVAFCKTGVNEVVNEDGFKVYPNPSTGVFVVDIPATEKGATITVMDVLGKVIERKVTTETRMQQVSFNLSNMPRGNYIVKVNAGERIFRQKIVIW